MIMMYLKIAFSLCGASGALFVVWLPILNFTFHLCSFIQFTFSELISCGKDAATAVAFDAEEAVIVAHDFV